MTIKSFESSVASEFGVDKAIMIYFLNTHKLGPIPDNPSSHIRPYFPFWTAEKVRSVFNEVIAEPNLEGIIFHAFSGFSAFEIIESVESIEEISQDGMSEEAESV